MTVVEPLKKFLRIFEKTEMVRHIEKMRKKILKIKILEKNTIAIKITVKGNKKERPKQQWMEVIKENTRRKGLPRELAKKNKSGSMDARNG